MHGISYRKLRWVRCLGLPRAPVGKLSSPLSIFSIPIYDIPFFSILIFGIPLSGIGVIGVIGVLTGKAAENSGYNAVSMRKIVL